MHKFVEYIPSELEEGILYVSIDYCVAVHRCYCGCGSEIVTPIAPTGWKITFDGDTVSLTPSIGNWNLSCRSHYWIERNKVYHFKDGDFPFSFRQNSTVGKNEKKRRKGKGKLKFPFRKKNAS